MVGSGRGLGKDVVFQYEGELRSVETDPLGALCSGLIRVFKNIDIRQDLHVDSIGGLSLQGVRGGQRPDALEKLFVFLQDHPWWFDQEFPVAGVKDEESTLFDVQQ